METFSYQLVDFSLFYLLHNIHSLHVSVSFTCPQLMKIQVVSNLLLLPKKKKGSGYSCILPFPFPCIRDISHKCRISI